MNCACSMCAGSEAFDLEPTAVECDRYAGHPQPASLEETVARIVREMVVGRYVLSLREVVRAMGSTHLDVADEQDIEDAVRVQLAAMSESAPIPRVIDERLSMHRQLRCGACLCAVEPSDAWCPLPDCAVEFKTLSNDSERLAAE